MKKTTLSSIATAIAIVSVMASCQNKDDKGTTTKESRFSYSCQLLRKLFM